jgi:putative spermidine/putrescine transport system permease protein
VSEPSRTWRRLLDRGGAAVAGIGEGAALLLLMGPIVLVIWLSFGADRYTTIPPTGYGLKWYANILARGEFIPAFWVSLKIALIVTPFALIAGTLGAFALNRFPSRGSNFIQSMLYSPIIIPQVVTGIALLYFFQIVAVRDAFWNIVIGHIIITFPYVVRTVSVALARYDLALDDAAASLGAKPAQVFWLVTLPLIRPGLFAGALFAFVMSFDDFTVTIFLTGTKTHTLPIAIYHYLEWNVDATVSAVSAVLVFLAVGVMLLVERLIGLDRFVGVRG